MDEFKKNELITNGLLKDYLLKELPQERLIYLENILSQLEEERDFDKFTGLRDGFLLNIIDCTLGNFYTQGIWDRYVIILKYHGVNVAVEYDVSYYTEGTRWSNHKKNMLRDKKLLKYNPKY